MKSKQLLNIVQDGIQQRYWGLQARGKRPQSPVKTCRTAPGTLRPPAAEQAYPVSAGCARRHGSAGTPAHGTGNRIFSPGNERKTTEICLLCIIISLHTPWVKRKKNAKRRQASE